MILMMETAKQGKPLGLLVAVVLLAPSGKAQQGTPWLLAANPNSLASFTTSTTEPGATSPLAATAAAAPSIASIVSSTTTVQVSHLSTPSFPTTAAVATTDSLSTTVMVSTTDYSATAAAKHTSSRAKSKLANSTFPSTTSAILVAPAATASGISTLTNTTIGNENGRKCELHITTDNATGVTCNGETHASWHLLANGDVCIPMCNAGYSPSTAFLFCSHGILIPSTFQCYQILPQISNCSNTSNIENNRSVTQASGLLVPVIVCILLVLAIIIGALRLSNVIGPCMGARGLAAVTPLQGALGRKPALTTLPALTGDLKVGFDGEEEQANLLPNGDYESVNLAEHGERAFDPKNIFSTIGGELFILIVVMPALVLVACLALGCCLAIVEGWSVRTGFQYIVSTTCGLANPLGLANNVNPETNTGMIMAGVCGLWSLGITGILGSWISSTKVVNVCIGAITDLLGVEEKSASSRKVVALGLCVFLLSPCVLALFVLFAGGLLALVESWRWSDGCFYILANIAGLPNPLVQSSPATSLGRGFDAIISAWCFVCGGIIIGLAASLPL